MLLRCESLEPSMSLEGQKAKNPHLVSCPLFYPRSYRRADIRNRQVRARNGHLLNRPAQVGWAVIKRVAQGTDLSVRVSGQEGENEPCSLVVLLIQSEMASIEQMDLGIWQIALESLCPRSNERGIVPSPDHQSRRLVLAQPRLPRRI